MASKKFKGKVVHSDLEGGLWQLEGDDGNTYTLEGGDAKLHKPGVKVEIEGSVDDGAMGIGFGAPVLQVKTFKVL
jgi:hypothetical protein